MALINTVDVWRANCCQSAHLPIESNKKNEFSMVDDATRKSLSGIPLLKTKAGPREKEQWVQRLKEEFQALIKYVETNKQQDNDWFRLESNKEGTRWFGKCWYIQDLLKYEFDVEFDVSGRSDFYRHSSCPDAIKYILVLNIFRYPWRILLRHRKSLFLSSTGRQPKCIGEVKSASPITSNLCGPATSPNLE